MRFTFEAFGETLVDRDLVRVSEHAGNLKPILGSVGRFIFDMEKRLFETQGASGGHKWKRLAPATVKAKSKAGLRPEILRATDKLMNSLTKEGAEDQTFRVTADSLTLQSNVSYGRFHATGTVRMPQRRPVAFAPTNKQAIVKGLQRYIMTGEVMMPGPK